MFFFFSSRRRHTRFDCDWSSDVCSSDLSLQGKGGVSKRGRRHCISEKGELATLSGKCSVPSTWITRSEEHTSELQSQSNLVCRLLLEKKKKKQKQSTLSHNQ